MGGNEGGRGGGGPGVGGGGPMTLMNRDVFLRS